MLTAIASLWLAVVVQDQTPLRAAPTATAATHVQLQQGDVLEVRAAKLDHVQVWDHRRERAGYVRASQLRPLPGNEAEAAQAQAVWRFLRDTPGQESLGIAYVAAYLKALPPGAATADAHEALGVMAERLALRASAPPSPRQAAAAAHLDVVAPFGVKFQSWEQGPTVRLCYQGDAFQQVLAMKASASQKTVAALALTRHDCVTQHLRPDEVAHRDAWRAEVLDGIDTAAALPPDLKNRLHLRRAGVWSAIAFQRARAQPSSPSPQSHVSAAQRAIDELAKVDKSQLGDDDQRDFQDAALRVGAVRWAAAPPTPPMSPTAPGGRVGLRTEAGEPGQTCLRVVETAQQRQKGAKEENELARHCTYAIVWAASARVSADGRALAVSVQPTPTWTELWLFRAGPQGQGWTLEVLPPAAAQPGLGYAEWAGFVPGASRMLVAREALGDGGKLARRFEVLSLDGLVTERWASTPELLAAFRWQDPQWKRHTLALR
jgi:hypothetical protein